MQNVPLSSERMPTDWVFAQDQTRKMKFSFSLQIEQADGIIQKDEHLKEKNPVWFMFDLKGGWPKMFKAAGTIEYKKNRPSLTVTKVKIPNDHGAYKTDPILFDKERGKILALRPGSFRDEQVWKIIRYVNIDENQWRNDYVAVGNAVYGFFIQLYDEVFKDLFVSIRAIRKIEPLGDEIVESLFKLSQGIPEKIELHDSIVNYIKSLVFAGESSAYSLCLS